MNELIIIGGTLSIVGLILGISAFIVWKVDSDISFRQIFNDLHDFIDWHLPWTFATMPKIEEHFNLTLDEITMIESCIDNKLLKEYVIFTENHHRAYITLKVADVRKLVNLRRKNIGN